MEMAIISERYPFLLARVSVGKLATPKFQTEDYALLDTGFDGDVIVPETLLDRISEKPDGVSFCQVGDGRVVGASVYIGTLEIGYPFNLPSQTVSIAFMGDTYLVGRGVIDKYQITLDHGEKVILKP